MKVLLLSTLMTSGLNAMSYLFNKPVTPRTKRKQELNNTKKIIFAIHEINSNEVSDVVLCKKFIESFNRLTDEEKIERARRGAIFNDPATGQMPRYLAQLNGHDLHSLCQELEIPTYWAR